MNEADARRVVLVQAYDNADSPQWTREDAAWATRLATQALGADAPVDRLLAERARHALQRLQARDRDVQRWLSRSLWRWHWMVLAAALGVVAGFGADLIDRHQIVNVLAPAAWAVVAWNLAIYLALLWNVAQRWRAPDAAAPGGLRRSLLAWWQRASGDGPLRVATRRWAELSAPLALARVAALLHVAAAALGAGVVASMYLRGLVLDFRAGWQSTFLDAATVHQLLSVLLAPAVAVTGVALPDAQAFEAMRLTPGQAATAGAAPWIHLYAATLAMAVVVPRLALALAAALQATVRARRIRLPLTDPATLREVQRLQRRSSVVQVCPYAQAAGAQAALGLRRLLAGELGDDLQLQFAAATAVGDEDDAPARLANGHATLRVVLVDLAAIPEEDHHGRFVAALRAAGPQLPLLLVVDESAYRQRFASMPDRIGERRAAWRQWAVAHELQWRSAPLDDLHAIGAAGAPVRSASAR
ncbi:MAG TPA: DUF2868 domain-containing protein [Burkholderiaceae bacterium]|nr:DUF2868 domain-containing protein [Burkholderiaceae bacterium]